MFESILVRNFKSLAGVDLHLSQFNCLIGMNGAGKSTLLQALGLAHHLMLGDVSSWMAVRNWKPGDLRCNRSSEKNINVGLAWRSLSGAKVAWVATFNPSLMRCTSELVQRVQWDGATINSQALFQYAGQRFSIEGRPWQELSVDFEGSLLGIIKDKELPEDAIAFREAVRNIRSLELLAPQLLRKRSRSIDGTDIGPGGEKLTAYLATLRGESRQRLLAMLRSFYPQIVDFKVGTVQAGWKKLTVVEQYGEHRQETEATHLSDGVLRMLAVLSQVEGPRSMILLDEVENGINPEIIQPLVNALRNASQQVLVTTHSPLILNYLPDDEAKQAVQFVYKNPAGDTRVRPLFSLERMSRKLEFMGPGEAFVDTNLNELTAECVALDVAQAAATPPALKGRGSFPA